MQMLAGVGPIEKLATPTFGAVTSTTGGFTFSITNYSASNGYTVSTTAGSASQTSGTVTQSGLGYSASATVSIYATRTGYETSDTATQAGTSSACVPAGCTPTCATYAYSYTTTCATGQGGAEVPGSCGAPGCTTGCRYYNLDWSVSAGGSCTDNCGVVYYASCPPISSQSASSTCC